VRGLAVAATALVLAGSARGDDVVEPQTGVHFADKTGDMTLLGVGLRIKKIAFISAKVYAIGFYVADAALAGPLAQSWKAGPAAFNKDVVAGDFPKQVTLKFVRDLSQGRIQEAMREALAGADKVRTDTFVSYFPEVKTGQECVLRWGEGGALETTMAGQARPPIPDKAFTTAVFSIWLGDKPIQEDVKIALLSRVPALMK